MTPKNGGGTKTRPAISEQATALRDRFAGEHKAMEAIKTNMDALALDYETALRDVDEFVTATNKLHLVDEEAQFIEAVQGSKGTGLQRSNHLITLRQIRKQRFGSLRAMSEDIGIPFPHLSEIERGLRLATPEELDAIEKYVGGRIHYRMVPYASLPEGE